MRENHNILTLQATSKIFFPLGDGVGSTTEKSFSIPEIEKLKNLKCGYFTIKIEEKTDTHLIGKVVWEDDQIRISPTNNGGKFDLSFDQPDYMTEPLNVSYNTFAILSLSLEFPDIS